jgi:hypothetical protein
MGRGERSTSQGADQRPSWLRSTEPTRSRPWAYEELLFGSDDDEANRALSSLAADLAVDLAELKRMQDDLHDQVVKIARLEGRLHALARSAEGVDSGRVDDSRVRPEIRSVPSDPLHSPASVARGRSLGRCEGFRVESSAGFVGYVEGLRFVSRIDEPDLIEVRGGRFGRELLLIPIEAVEDILLDEECVVVRGAPRLQEDHLHDLVERVRRMLHVHPSAS